MLREVGSEQRERQEKSEGNVGLSELHLTNYCPGFSRVGLSEILFPFLLLCTEDSKSMRRGGREGSIREKRVIAHIFWRAGKCKYKCER